MDKYGVIGDAKRLTEKRRASRSPDERQKSKKSRRVEENVETASSSQAVLTPEKHPFSTSAVSFNKRPVLSQIC